MAVLDRLTHQAHILEMDREIYRLKHVRENAAFPAFRGRGRRINPTVNAVSSCSGNIATLPDLLLSFISQVVHDYSATAVHDAAAVDRRPQSTICSVVSLPHGMLNRLQRRSFRPWS